MSAIVLHRIDPTRNMARFYRLDIQPDLFGGVSVVKEWGRIGRGGQIRRTLYANSDEARAAVEHHKQVKERRGYQNHPA